MTVVSSYIQSHLELDLLLQPLEAELTLRHTGLQNEAPGKDKGLGPGLRLLGLFHLWLF